MIFSRQIPESFDLNGINVKLRKNDRARRIIVKIHAGGAELVIPKRSSLKTALTFLASKENWVRERLAARPARISMGIGSTISVFGEMHEVVYGGMRGKPAISDGKITIYGDESLAAAKVKKLLSSHLKSELSRVVTAKTAELGVRHNNITIRDTTSRWGSCSSTGNLSFCWKIAFAPYHVVEYLACHEVAHLAEMNHSKSFWDKVAQICPNYEVSENWLKKNGNSLHLYE